MRLPRFVATTAVRETGLVRAQDIGALTNVRTGEFREIEQAGRAVSRVSDLGFRAFMSRQSLDDVIEAGDVNQKDQELWREGRETAANYIPSVDEVLPNDPNYLKKTTATIFSNAVKAKVRASILSKIQRDSNTLYASIQSSRTKKLLIMQRNERLADEIERIDKALNRIHHQYQVKKITNYAETAAKNGDIDVANYWVDKGLEHKLFNDAIGDELKSDYAELAKKSLDDRIIDAVVSQALMFTVQEGVAQGLPDTEAALKFIRESGLSPSNQVKGNTTYNALVKQQKDAIDVQRETDRDTLNTALVNDELTPGLIDGTSLPETEQLAYDKLYRNWAKDKDQIVTDEQVRADLRRSVINIGRGANTKTQVVALLNEAAFGDNPTIDNAAYKELSALAETTLNKVQGDFLTEAHRDGQEQLVDLGRETFMALAIAGRLSESQIQKRKIQLWWADRYDNEMEQWIQDNPDKNKREGYQQAEMVLAGYINMSFEQIEALRTRTLSSLQEQNTRRREGRPMSARTPLIEGEIFPTPAKKPLIEGELETGRVVPTGKPAIQMQSPTGVPIRASLATIGARLDRGDVFPPGSDIRVKRNASDKTVSFEGLSIEPGKRVISLDGGKTWQLLP